MKKKNRWIPWMLCALLAQLDMYAFLVLSLLLWGAQYVAQGR